MNTCKKRILCVALSALLLFAPTYTYAASKLYSTIHAMTNAELLELYADLETEMESRGLSPALSSSIGKAASKASEPTVWVPQSGSKYHSRESCSNMKDPHLVTLSEAKACGFTPCKRCSPPK